MTDILFISELDFGISQTRVDNVSTEVPYNNDEANVAIELINKLVGNPELEPKVYTPTMFDRYKPGYYEKFKDAVNIFPGGETFDVSVSGQIVAPLLLEYNVSANGETFKLKTNVTETMYDGSTGKVRIPKVKVLESLQQRIDSQPENELHAHLIQSDYLLSRLKKAKMKYLDQKGWTTDQDLRTYNQTRVADKPGPMFTYVLLKWFRKELEADIRKHINERRTAIVEAETYTSSRKPYPFPSVESVNAFLDNLPTATEVLMLEMMISMAFNTLDSIRYRYTGNTVSRKLSNMVPKSMGKWFRGSRYKKAFQEAAKGTRYGSFDRKTFRDLRNKRKTNSRLGRRFGRAANIAVEIERMRKQLDVSDSSDRGLRTAFDVVQRAKKLVREGEKYNPDNQDIKTLKAKINETETTISNQSPDLYHRLVNSVVPIYGGKKTKQRRNTERRKTRRQTLHSRR